MNPTTTTNEPNSISQHHQINIPTASHTLPPIKLPCTDLVGVRDDYNMICVPLYRASNTGDWESAKSIFGKSPHLVRYSITENYETPLHIAVSATYTTKGKVFVEELVKLTTRDELELQNGDGETALHMAAVAGNVEMAKIIVKENAAVLTIPNCEGKMPLCKAVTFSNHKMVKYLYDSSEKMTTRCWTKENRNYVLVKCIQEDLFDIALQIVKDCPELAPNGDALGFFARNPHVFTRKHYKQIFGRTFATSKYDDTSFAPHLARQLFKLIWSSILKLDKDEISNIIRGPPDPTKSTACNNQTQENEKLKALEEQEPKYSSQMLFVAAQNGNKTFIVELIDSYPDLIRKVNDNNQSIFHVAVSHRQTGIFCLLNDIGSMKDSVISLEDKNGNNMLHLSGERPKGDQLQDVPGVVLQMQHELLWFKEVEEIHPHSFWEKKNIAGLTPHEVFTNNHKDLVIEGERWMKQVATQLMVVATLVATVAFAVPFTVPGGFNQDTGNPIFIGKKLFTAFMIFDALSLMLASTSLAYVISILTTTYAERDFLRTLPEKLMVCLGTLLHALFAMLLTFALSIFILYENKSVGAPISIAVLVFLMFIFIRSQVDNLMKHFKMNTLDRKQVLLSSQS